VFGNNLIKQNDAKDDQDGNLKFELSSMATVNSVGENIAYEEKGKSVSKFKCTSWQGLIQRLAFLVLLLAMLSIASGGVAMRKFSPEVQKKPILISMWRYQMMLIFVLPITIFQLKRMKPEERAGMKQVKLWLLVIVGGISVSLWTGTWAVSIMFTTLTRAYLLNNCQPLLIVIWNKIRRHPVNKMHFLGVFLGIVGLLFVCLSSGLTDHQKFSARELIGDGIAFGVSIAAAIYISIGGRIRNQLPAFVYFAPAALISVIIFGIGTVTIEHSHPIEFFGWTAKSEIGIVAWLALVTGLLGISLISVVMKYLPPLVISIVLLFEPIAASIMAIMVKVEPLPNAWTWAGAILVSLGILIVTLGYYNPNLSAIRHKLRKRFSSGNL